jgi:hypothetical protein
MQRQALVLFLWVVGLIACVNAMGDDTPKPIRYFSYRSDAPGCRANPATDLTLMVDGDGEQWVIVAPARVVSTESERKRARGPLDIEIAGPLESTLRKRLADSRSEGRIKSGESNTTRIKIVTVTHDIVGLGMGKALANIWLDFYVCVNGDLPENSIVKTVGRSGPQLSTLWQQPRGEELQAAFRIARDKAFSAIVDLALRPID